MAALISVISGRYSSTYTIPAGAAVDLGVTNDPGYKLAWTPSWENIDKTDAYGDNVIDQVWLGLSSVTLDFVSKEYKVQPLAAATQFAVLAPTGAGTFSAGLTGRRATDMVGTVIMTATAGTPAASTPASLTALYASLHEGNNVEVIFGPRHRTIPIKFRIIANGTTTPNYFTVT